MKCEYCGNEHDGTYGSGRFCNITCRNRFNYIKARKQFVINVKERARIKHEKEQNTEYICELCGKHYLLKDGISKRFCSNFCSKKFSSIKNNEERKKNISLTYAKKYNYPEHKYCQDCGVEINRKKKNSFCKTCAAHHRALFYKLNPDNPEYEKYKYRLYRSKCTFNFSIRDYPEEFDIKLIEQYGFYKPSNRGNNLNGISRDHMYSINEGYKNGIDPKILAHPANCKLMRHNDNISKGKNSTITLEELLKRIEEWDLKYKK